MTDASLVDALRRSRLGPELSEEQARTLAAYLAFRDLKPDEVLVREGASDDHLYVIVSGALGVVRRAGTPDAVTLLTLTTGDLVGELSFIDETPHYASLISIGPTRVFGLEREKLEALLLERPEIVYRVMRAIVRTVHEIQRRISMQSVELTNYIYKQHGKY
ncbi:MAG TPA: cyclic nucleotide-binding domain-containing protein [Casimicrobiaceae bacterium]|nr:cyclic nucleotide-binding domain-containing protein [Casimicrobiaceae bacterium]